MTGPVTDIACTLEDEGLSNRRVLFQQRLLPHLIRSSWIDSGLRLVFPSDPALHAEIDAFIALERRCCKFLDFELEEDAVEPVLVLAVTGPKGTQEFLHQMLLGCEDDTVGSAVTPPRLRDKALKRSGLAGIVTGAACLLVCELPVLLTIIGLSGTAAMLAYFQPGPIIEAGASVLILAGSITYFVWRRRQSG